MAGLVTLLSVGWAKYYFPIGFLGALAVAVWVADSTHNLDLRYVVCTLGGSLRRLRLSRPALQVFLAIVFLVDGGVFTFLMVQHDLNNASDAVYQVQAYINQNTPPQAVIETYDSELLFLLDRPCHFPPDHLQMLLNRRTIYGLDQALDYDPLSADPDYLIVGPWSRTWKLNDAVLESGEFSPIFTVPGYQVYQRNR